MAGRKKIEIENVEEATAKTTKPKATQKRDLAEIMAEKEAKMKTEQLSEIEQRRLERKRQMEMLRKIDDDLPILMYCNAGNTTVVYDCPKTMQHYEMVYGDVEYMTYKEIKTMKSLHPTMLENFILVPIDVNSDDYTLEDILKILRIDHLYGEEMLIDGNIDYMINNLKYDTFVSLIKETSKPYVRLVIDRAIELAKINRFTDYAKMTYLETITKNPDMFKEAIENYNTFK
jgi:hypothetical protein